MWEESDLQHVHQKNTKEYLQISFSSSLALASKNHQTLQLGHPKSPDHVLQLFIFSHFVSILSWKKHVKYCAKYQDWALNNNFLIWVKVSVYRVQNGALRSQLIFAEIFRKIWRRALTILNDHTHRHIHIDIGQGWSISLLWNSQPHNVSQGWGCPGHVQLRLGSTPLQINSNWMGVLPSFTPSRPGRLYPWDTLLGWKLHRTI